MIKAGMRAKFNGVGRIRSVFAAKNHGLLMCIVWVEGVDAGGASSFTCCVPLDAAFYPPHAFLPTKLGPDISWLRKPPVLLFVPLEEFGMH